MNRRVILLGSGLLLAAWLAFFADKTPDGEVIEAVAPASKKKTVMQAQGIVDSNKSLSQENRSKAGKTSESLVIASIIDRKSLIAGDYKGNDSFFGAQSWTPPPPPAVKPPPPPPPTAPPLPFRYLGKKTDDGPIEVYLVNGDHTYIVQEKTVLDNLYRVDAIQPTTMTITYLPLNQVQTLQIGSAE